MVDIGFAFNNARTAENTQLSAEPYTPMPGLTMPSQTEWTAMSDGEKALWLINEERTDRSVHPLHGLETNVTSVAQYYAEYLIANDAWGHNEDGRTPWERLEANAAIGACHDSLNVAENLAYFATTDTSIPLPVERAVYNWIYNDSGSSWLHRRAALWYPYTDNSGPAGKEGFLGIGRDSGTYKGWNFAEMIVMNVFDPCAAWAYVLTAPSGLSATAVSQTQIDLSWTDNSDDEDGFKIERSPDGTTGWTQIATVGAGVTSYSDTSLTCDQTYYYRVRAYNANGNSGYSNIANARPSCSDDWKVYLPLLLRNYIAGLLYFDDFSDSNSGWDIGDDANFASDYDDGNYRMQIKTNDRIAWSSAPSFTCANCTIEVEAWRSTGGNSRYGIIFGLDNSVPEFYLFAIQPYLQQYYLQRYGGDGWVTLIPHTDSSYINFNQAHNTLKVIRQDSQISLYVNDHYLTSYSDSTYTGSRRVGVAAISTGESPVWLRYDNFTVWAGYGTTSATEGSSGGVGTAPAPPD